jgi:hypothetical protein
MHFWCKCRECRVHPSGGRPHRAFLPVLSPRATGAVSTGNPTSAHPGPCLMRPDSWKRHWQRYTHGISRWRRCGRCGQTAESDVVPNSLPFWQVDRYHALGRMGPAQAKHAPAIVNVLAVSFLEFMQCHLRGSGGPATCKTVARRDCAPHTVMRAGRPRTRHAHGSIMLHFTRVRMPLALPASRLAPLASCPLTVRCNVATGDVQRSTFQPSTPRHCPRCRYGRSAAAPLHRPAALAPYPLATAPAAGTGAAPLRPSIAPPPSRPSPRSPTAAPPPPRNACRRDAENARPSRTRSGAQSRRVRAPIQADRPVRERHSAR